MNRKTIAVVVTWAAFGLCSFAVRLASAQITTCSADSDCATGTKCVETEATGCIDTCASSGGCVGVPCKHYIKTCVATCSQDSDCSGATYCQHYPYTFTCPSGDAGAGGTSTEQGCVESFSIGQCMYHPLGSLPEGGSSGMNAGAPNTTAGAANEEGTPEGGSAGQTSSPPKTQDANPSAEPATSTSGGCAVAFGASNVGSASVLLFGLGVVVARRRRRAASTTNSRSSRSR